MDTNNAGPSGLPIVLQFHAAWCGPCRALAPHLGRLEEEYRGRVEVRRIDVDREPETARQFGVRGVPTLVALSEGQERERTVGGQSPRALERFFARAAGEPVPEGGRGLEIERLRIPAVVLALALTLLAGQPSPFRYLSWLAFPLLVWGMAGRCAICSLATRGVGHVLGRLLGRRTT
jgi:thioredoxin